MKKINLFLLFITVGILGFMTSCEDTGDTDPVGPTITFKAPAGAITTDATVGTGETVMFSWEVTKGDASLEEFTIRMSNQDVEGFPNTDIDKDQYEDTFDTVFSAAGTYEFAFIATDKDGEKDTKTITVTVVTSGNGIVSQTAKIMADIENPSGGSFYSISDGAVMSYAEAKASPANVDLVYYYGNTNKASICSPNDTEAEAFKDNSDNVYLQQLSTRNATKLAATSVSKTDFEAATNDALITANVPASTSTAVKDLAVDDVFYFETVDGKMGLALVKEITGAQGSSTITLDLIVQE